MVGWNDLPKSFKKEVVKKLDVMSRHSMRCSSQTERSIVDSTEFYIPRVRVSIKGHKSMMMIYTGIEKFLRMEFQKGSSDEIVIYKMENSYKLENAIMKEVPSIGPCSFIRIPCEILKTLFIHQSILIGTLEIEFSIPEKYKAIQLSMYREIVIGIGNLKERKNLFRTKKFITNYKLGSSNNRVMARKLCDLEVLDESNIEGFQFFPKYLFPRRAFDMNSFSNFVPQRFTQIWMFDDLERTLKQLHDYATDDWEFATCRFGQEMNDEQLWDSQKCPIEQLNDKVQMKRSEYPQTGLVVRWNKSKCGVWAHMMKSDQEEKHLDFFQKETCGLRWMCKKCTDPFDYWFYQTLPRRFHYEPDWTETGYLPEPGDPHPKFYEMLEELKELFEKDEKKNMKKYKKKSYNKMKKSWGFRRFEDEYEEEEEENNSSDENIKNDDDVATTEVSGDDEKVSEFDVFLDHLIPYLPYLNIIAPLLFLVNIFVIYSIWNYGFETSTNVLLQFLSVL